jgi:hypothetical protein
MPLRVMVEFSVLTRHSFYKPNPRQHTKNQASLQSTIVLAIEQCVALLAVSVILVIYTYKDLVNNNSCIIHPISMWCRAPIPAFTYFAFPTPDSQTTNCMPTQHYS